MSTAKWLFVGEGNAHVVVREGESPYVLRIVKSTEFPDVTRYHIAFTNIIMQPLLCKKQNLNEQNDLIKLSPIQVSEIMEVISEGQSKLRNPIVSFSMSAIKAPNLTLASSSSKINYCIEIKPKEGFLSKSLQNYSKCYYCMKQCLKFEQKLIKEVSLYCPLDLFSGDKKRMCSAIVSLIKNPQNNFKVFKNSVQCADSDNVIKDIPAFKGSLKTFVIFLVEILLNDDQDCAVVCDDNEDIDDLKLDSQYCNSTNILRNNCVLSRILNVQKLSEVYNDYDTNKDSDTFDYVRDILDIVQKNELELSLDADQHTFVQKLSSHHLAMLAAIAKDCSIMISFSPHSPESDSRKITINGYDMIYKIRITDLEPKPITTLGKRKLTEEKIVKAYNNTIINTKYVHTETRTKQLEAWQQLITDYLKANKLSTLDIREAQSSPLFNNTTISRKLSHESVLTILEDMAKKGRAAPTDKTKNVWEVYWHSLDEWGNMLYSWASTNGMNNSVCTLFELTDGDTTVGEEFHGLDTNILIKALKCLEVKGKCELMEYDENQGVKFF